MARGEESGGVEREKKRAECEAWSVESGVGSSVDSAERRVESAESRVECDEWTVECGEGSAEWGE